MKATAASSVMKVDLRCKHCGKNHDSNACWYMDQKCFNCGKVGHVASVCRAEKNFQAPSQGRNSRSSSANFSKIRTTRPQRGPQSGKEERTHWVASDNPDEADTQQDGALSLFTVGKPGIPVKVAVNHESLVMELDTGAAVSIISEEVVKEKFPGASIQPSSVLLKTEPLS